jgi:hypothetical protein
MNEVWVSEPVSKTSLGLPIKDPGIVVLLNGGPAIGFWTLEDWIGAATFSTNRE